MPAIYKCISGQLRQSFPSLSPHTHTITSLVYDMALQVLLFSIATLLLDSTYALPSMINGSSTLNALAGESCAATMDGQLPSFVPSNFHFSGTVRHYYIAAEEVEWDYAPTEWDNWLGVRASMSTFKIFEY
jgi:hypothetical protein